MFSAKSTLLRFIDKDQSFSKGRVAPGAFLLKERETYLSVHSPEIQSKREIVEYYKQFLAKGASTVRICSHKIYDYNRAVADTPAKVDYDQELRSWMFVEKGSPTLAYLHRENQDSKAHCGVEYIRILNEDHRNRVARRLATRKYFTAR